MSKSQHVLKVQKDGVTYTCEMYTTPQEARDNLYAGQYVRFNKNGTNLYVPLTPTLNSATESTPLLMYKKGDNTKYCIAQKSFFRANVTPTANAVITAKAYNEGGTEIDSWNTGAKWFPYGTRITATGVGNPSNIWNNPTMRIDRGTNAGETMTVSNVEIGAAAAVTRKSYSFTLNPGSNQTVTIKYTEPGKNEVPIDVSGSSRQFTVLAGTTWTASITSVATGFNKGSLSATKGTITGSGVSITATNATRKTYTLKLNGTTGQTITLYFTQPGSSQQKKTSTSSAQSWTVAYGTTYKAELAANTGYTKGSLSIAEGATYTITGNATISATAASIRTVNVTLNQPLESNYRWTKYTFTYTRTDGTTATINQGYVTSGTRTVAIKYNTKISLLLRSVKNAISGDESTDNHVQLWCGGTRYIDAMYPPTWTSWAITSDTTFRIYGS